MNKSSDVLRYFEDLLRSPRSINDTSRLGYISTSKKGESSSNGEKKNNKGKPTCHHYEKIGCTTNIYRSKNGNQSPKKNTKVQCKKCKKQGHQAHECGSKLPAKQNFNRYRYNCHKFGNRASECISKPNKTPIMLR